MITQKQAHYNIYKIKIQLTSYRNKHKVKDTIEMHLINQGNRKSVKLKREFEIKSGLNWRGKQRQIKAHCVSTR